MNREEILKELELTIYVIDTINKMRTSYDEKALQLIRMLKDAH